MLLAPCPPQSRGVTPTRTPSAESGFPPEQGCKSLLPSAESGFCHPNKVASPSTQPGFLSYPRWDRAEPKIPASEPEPNADASGPFLTWDAVDNKVLIFLPLSAVSNDEGELPHIQKSDEKESRAQLRSSTATPAPARKLAKGSWYRMASLVPQSVEWDSGGEHVQLCQIR